MSKNKPLSHRKTAVGALLLLIVLSEAAFAGPADFNIDGVFEVALDLPRILFLLKRDPNEPPLEYQGEFLLNWAFLDTGASGILLSRETVTQLEIDIDPNAQYVDVGVGGSEFFDVSEPLYIGTADFNDPDPNDPNHYLPLLGSWCFQVNQSFAGDFPNEPIDLLGTPVMVGKTIVLNAGAVNRLEYFSAVIKDSNDPTIPEVDFTVPLRQEKYIMPKDPNNIPPLPVLAYNPVIDNITTEYNGNSFTATWILDTGGTLSLMSTAQAAALGLTDTNGTPLVVPDFSIPIGGIGEDVNIPGFQIDNLIIPTLNGYSLTFNNARIGVHDIGIIDEETGEFIILDGIFGSNFLCASAKLEGGWPIDFASGPFETIVIDMRNGLLGFDVNDVYPLPSCGDPQHPQPTGDLTGDCRVNFLDLYVLTENWLRGDCSVGNSYCQGADMDKTGTIDLVDYSLLGEQWSSSPFSSTCGDAEHPWLKADLNRDCSVDLHDLWILAEEWVNDCDWLNWNCRGADINSDNITNFADYAELVPVMQ